MCLPPSCFETRFGFASGFEGGQGIFFENTKIDEVIEGNIYALLVVTTINLVPLKLKRRVKACVKACVKAAMAIDLRVLNLVLVSGYVRC
jgi:hypothetical protein